MSIQIGILTVSDSAAAGLAEDKSGPILADLAQSLWPHAQLLQAIVADTQTVIAIRLQQWIDEKDVALVLTTGGTGFALRDVTPEATRDVIEREAPGMAEAIRAAGLKITPHAMLSRGIAGIRDRSLIVNFSGSPKAVHEQFAVIAPVLPHALELLRPDQEGIKHARSGEHQRQA